MIVVTPPADDALAVSVADLKSWIQDGEVASNERNLTRAIRAATAMAESYLGRAIIAQTRAVGIHGIPPADGIRLEPFATLTVKRYPSMVGAAAVVVPAPDYVANGDAGTVWAREWDSDIRRFESYRFEYTAGWEQDEIPDPIGVLILGIAADIYTYRGQRYPSVKDLVRMSPPASRYKLSSVARPDYYAY